MTFLSSVMSAKHSLWSGWRISRGSCVRPVSWLLNKSFVGRGCRELSTLSELCGLGDKTENGECPDIVQSSIWLEDRRAVHFRRLKHWIQVENDRRQERSVKVSQIMRGYLGYLFSKNKCLKPCHDEIVHLLSVMLDALWRVGGNVKRGNCLVHPRSGDGLD